MRYLPILQELFESDSVIFLVIGFFLAIMIGLRIKHQRKLATGAVLSLLVYAICEFASNIRSNFMVELILLFIGTIAIGCFTGFMVRLFILLIKKRANK